MIDEKQLERDLKQWFADIEKSGARTKPNFLKRNKVVAALRKGLTGKDWNNWKNAPRGFTQEKEEDLVF